MQESTKACLRRNNSCCIFKLLEYNYYLPPCLHFLSALWKLFDAYSFFFHFLLTKHRNALELSPFDMLEQGLCLLDTHSAAALFPCWRNLWMTQWVTTQLQHFWKNRGFRGRLEEVRNSWKQTSSAGSVAISDWGTNISVYNEYLPWS